MCLLMLFFKQEAIQQIIYLVRCQILKVTSYQRFRLKAHWLIGWFFASATSSSETGIRIAQSIFDADLRLDPFC